MAHKIFSIRKGSVQWNEEDRLALAAILLKCGYTVRLGRQTVAGKGGRSNPPQEYYVEYSEEGGTT